MPVADHIRFPVEPGYFDDYQPHVWLGHNEVGILRPFPRLGSYAQFEECWTRHSRIIMGQSYFTGWYEHERDQPSFLRVFPNTEEYVALMSHYNDQMSCWCDRNAHLYLKVENGWEIDGEGDDVPPHLIVDPRFSDLGSLQYVGLDKLGEERVWDIQVEAEMQVYLAVNGSCFNPQLGGSGQIATWEIVQREREQLMEFYQDHVWFLQTRCDCGTHQRDASGYQPATCPPRRRVPHSSDEIHSVTEMVRLLLMVRVADMMIKKLHE